MNQKDRALSEVLSEASQRLDAADIETPRREARLLAAWALDIDAAALLTRETMHAEALLRFDRALARRIAREPLAMILGHIGFWTLDFLVSPATLVPRGDTETLIEALLLAIPNRETPLRILDLGTGTGCLLLAALSEYPNAFGVGVDLSPEAASLARVNSQRNDLSARSVFLAGNWAHALSSDFDVVLSNPPYIESTVVPQLMPEVAIYEPGRALDGGPDGLTAYRQLIAVLPRLLVPTGLAIFELGQGQGPDVSALARDAGIKIVELREDVGGIGRALVMTPL